MLYNDEETRKSEERFQQHLKKARSLTKEDMDELMESIETLAATALKLKAKPSLTEEETVLLERIKNMIAEATQAISDTQLILGHSALRQANAYYQHVKRLAEEGNADAMKVYEDLKPHYQAALRDDLSNN